MKNKLLFFSLLVFFLLFVSIVEHSFAEDETFSIVNIEKDSGGKKVEIYLNQTTDVLLACGGMGKLFEKKTILYWAISVVDLEVILVNIASSI